MREKILTLAITASLLTLSGCMKNQDDVPGAADHTKAAIEISDIAVAEHLSSSRATVKKFMGSLKGELMAAMKTGGPLNALSVCNTKAPAISATVSKENQLNISRVSLKNRNPENAPTQWQAAVLKDFETQKAAGTDPKTLEFHEVVNVDGKPQFHYMKAIPLAQPACLICHGDQLPEDVKTKLSELYPEDKATGYKLGDIRGAFVVTKAL